MISTKFFVLILNTIVAILAKPTDLGVSGGTATTIDEHPWMVALLDGRYNRFSCSAFLISESWVLTAAHCTVRQAGGVKLGATNYHLDGIRFNISKVYIHQDYAIAVDGSPHNDIALIMLDSKVNESIAVPIALPEPNVAVPVGTFVNVTGWGMIDGQQRTIILHTTSIPVISAETCEDNFNHVYSIYDDIVLCAGQLGIQRGSCKGDSGGPVELNGVAVGITSWGKNACAADNGYPSVFTNLTSYRTWIKDVTGI